jgi:hypothetical protein
MKKVMGVLVLLLSLVSVCCSFPDRLSEMHVEDAVRHMAEWRKTSGSPFNEAAFRDNHAYVQRRNRRKSATYLLELNEVWADFPFPQQDENDDEGQPKTLESQKRATLPQGFLDWRKKNAVGPVKVDFFFFFFLFFFSKEKTEPRTM